MQKMFKNVLLIALTMVIASALFSCSENESMSNGENTYSDNTDLWPAYSQTTSRWGYINENGEMVIAAQYDVANNFSCGYAKVKSGGKYFFINTKGNEVTGQAVYDVCYDFYNSYAEIKKDNSYGLLNTKMEYAIQPIYYRLGQVGSNGMLSFRLSESGKYGYMDTSGNIKIATQYDVAGEFVNGLAVVSRGTKYGAINENNQMVIRSIYDDLGSAYNGRLIFSQGGNYGMLDKSGKVVVQPIYKSILADEFGTGIYPACSIGGKYGYIDVDGDVKINFEYDSASPFLGGMALVTKSNIYMVINEKNEVIRTFVNGSNSRIDYLDYHNGMYLIVISEHDTKTNRTISTYQWIKLPDTVVYSWVM